MIKKKWNIIGTVLILGFCAWLIINGGHNVNQLLKNHLLINNVQLSECHYGGNGNAGSLFIGYTFYLNGEKIEGSSSYQTSEFSVSDCQQHLAGSMFPVVYEANNPSNNVMMITPKVFKRFGYDFPDSLRWVLLYMKKQ